jgi:CRISPR/Cas system-associated exonuclease Cas4 (RecB family)
MVVKNDLQKYLDTKKADTRLLGPIERHLLKRVPDDRSTTVLHPSEMIKSDFCHRYAYYLLTGGIKKQSNPNLRLQNIFDEGHFIHAKWQNRIYEMGNMWGDFKCQNCGGITSGLSPKVCEHCKCVTLVYDEVALVDNSLRIAGHTDGWVKGLGDDFLIEIKSIGEGTLRFEAPDLLRDADHDLKKAWRNIRRPFRGHLLQGQMYLELARRMYGEDAPKEIVFLYELKMDQDYKEFTVKADYDMVERVFYKAQQINDAVDSGIMPKCNVDPSGCKQCDLIGD